MISTYGSVTDCQPITLDSIKKAVAELDKLRRPKSETVKRIHASRSVIEELRSMTIPVVVANRVAGFRLSFRGLPIEPNPYLADGCYAIEYDDGHIEFHGKDSP